MKYVIVFILLSVMPILSSMWSGENPDFTGDDDGSGWGNAIFFVFLPMFASIFHGISHFGWKTPRAAIPAGVILSTVLTGTSCHSNAMVFFLPISLFWLGVVTYADEAFSEWGHHDAH